MTITTLIGLTEQELDRAREEYEHELFQLEEIARYYDARMRRRNVKHALVRKLLSATDINSDLDKWLRLKEKNDEMDAQCQRDCMCWFAISKRKRTLRSLWKKMQVELDAVRESA